MRIIISPAKQMKIDDASYEAVGKPVFLKETKILLEKLKKFNFDELKTLLETNDKITYENFERFSNMNLENNLSPAILSYDGIQYKYICANIFDEEMIDYVEKNLRILSAFYGVLKPLDAITPYRLEMKAKLEDGLYNFWKNKIYDEVIDEDRVIINLASKEYSKIIEKYLSKDDRYISCIFYENDKGKLVQRAVKAKMARGEMVRFLASNKVEDVEKIKEFNYLGYEYVKELSKDNEFVFVKK